MRRQTPFPSLLRGFFFCLSFFLASNVPADNLDAPVFFQKTLTQQEVLIDTPLTSDNQASARWNADGSLSAWWCSSEVFGNGERHDMLRTATVFPGQSNLNPQAAVHSAGDSSAKHDRWNARNVCSPSIVDMPTTGSQDWTLLYYECSPMVYDPALPGNNPMTGQATTTAPTSFNQVCVARLTPQGWHLYDENLPGFFGDPETTKTTPVVRIRQVAIDEAKLADNNEPSGTNFAPPIDGHLYGDSVILAGPKHVGVSHPAAIYNPDGSGEMWLYYWDAWVHRMSLVKSADGLHFDQQVETNIHHPSHVKFFPDLEIDGHLGVWVGTAIFKGRRWFEYSFDGVTFIGTQSANPNDPTDPTYPQEEFALSITNTSHLCPAQGAGSFVSDRYGHVQGSGKFGFISGEGFRRQGNIPPGMSFCYHPDEDSHRGVTWGLYYLEGDFSDVDVRNESCELEGDPQPLNGRISDGTLLPDWTVNDVARTGRNRIERTDTGDIFPMAFFNNGQPMDGRDVCFLKHQSSMEQVIEGLTPFREYRVRAWVNARTSHIPGHFPTPTMRIELGGVVVEPGVSIPAVDVKNGSDVEFHEIVSTDTFTPTQPGDHDLTISQIASGDATLLVDRVIVEAVPEALTVTNASCEDGTIGEPYGLLDHGTTMPGWTASDPFLVGRNFATMTFFNNGSADDGNHVCLLDQFSSISQMVPGFQQGKKYRVRVWANGRTSPSPLGQSQYPIPVLRIELGGQVIETGASAPAVDPPGIYLSSFHEIVSTGVFTALASEPHELVLSQVASGNPTLLIDNIVIEEVP
ncbi:MAG: hypothetical protein K0U98_19750 [Deltaproteobacteria bacterium]|nr:hypothetical protein [Deltaproteobacteria bacterium]